MQYRYILCYKKTDFVYLILSVIIWFVFVCANFRILILLFWMWPLEHFLCHVIRIYARKLNIEMNPNQVQPSKNETKKKVVKFSFKTVFHN